MTLHEFNPVENEMGRFFNSIHHPVIATQESVIAYARNFGLKDWSAPSGWGAVTMLFESRYLAQLFRYDTPGWKSFTHDLHLNIITVSLME